MGNMVIFGSQKKKKKKKRENKKNGKKGDGLYKISGNLLIYIKINYMKNQFSLVFFVYINPLKMYNLLISSF